MKQVAAAKVTGFVESSSDTQGEVIVAGIRFKIKSTEDLEDGDLVALSATLDEQGSWHGTITMHLGRPAGHTEQKPVGKAQPEPRPSPEASTPPRLQSVQPTTGIANTAKGPAATAPAPAAGAALSRAQRFAQAQGQPSPRSVPAPASATPAAAPKTRPTFNIDEDVDLDIPF